jgi:hypothetical protein
MRHEFQQLLARAERITGRRYPQLHTLLGNIADEHLTRALLDDFRRLAGDVEQEVASAKRQGNRDAWQRGRHY